ncbi:hypothetical protein B0H66DRAFT_535301 [Apodospora peruviana]|uniref:Uncharacterized protein n=1 Tax=Apodospora peruviana TaxID=516989 RepID=A0AAE0I267_9PEZI|nr:hypothetical protein B0H66DRAFT_535301 [Apodospora peruviana]
MFARREVAAEEVAEHHCHEHEGDHHKGHKHHPGHHHHHDHHDAHREEHHQSPHGWKPGAAEGLEGVGITSEREVLSQVRQFHGVQAQAQGSEEGEGERGSKGGGNFTLKGPVKLEPVHGHTETQAVLKG